MIYVTGDTHGDMGRFFGKESRRTHKLHTSDYLIVCGDFGFIFKDDAREDYNLDKLSELPHTILFVDGNHENFDVLEEIEVSQWNGGKVHKIRGEKIIHLMRGQVYNIDGHRIFTMGGGFSKDRMLREEGDDWWPEEMPDSDEYEQARVNLSANGYKVDYIISHTAPEKALEMVCQPHRHEERLTGFLDWIRKHVEFKHWYMGHLRTNEDLWHNQTVLYKEVRNLLTNETVDDE